MVQLRYKAPRVSIVLRAVVTRYPRDVMQVASPPPPPPVPEPAPAEETIGASRVTVRQIVEVAGRVSGFTDIEIVSPRRFYRLCEVRQCVMFLARKHTNLSLPKIGILLGKRDHTTVVHAVKKIGENFDKYRDFISNCELLLPVDSRENPKRNAQDTDKSDRLAA